MNNSPSPVPLGRLISQSPRSPLPNNPVVKKTIVPKSSLSRIVNLPGFQEISLISGNNEINYSLGDLKVTPKKKEGEIVTNNKEENTEMYSDSDEPKVNKALRKMFAYVDRHNKKKQNKKKGKQKIHRIKEEDKVELNYEEYTDSDNPPIEEDRSCKKRKKKDDEDDDPEGDNSLIFIWDSRKFIFNRFIFCRKSKT
jgi:hypothetical protein